MTDELRPGEPESATILYLSKVCPLCGHRGLDPRAEDQRCIGCGAWVKRGVAS